MSTFLRVSKTSLFSRVEKTAMKLLVALRYTSLHSRSILTLWVELLATTCWIIVACRYHIRHIQTNVWVNFNRTGITTPYPLKDLHTSCLWKASKLTIFCLVWNIAPLRPEWFGCHDSLDDRLPLQHVKYCTLFCNKMLIHYRSRTGFNCESLNCEFF